MNIVFRAAFAASLFAATIGTAIAHDGPAYPVSVSEGENSAIMHGPGNARGTLVGGGRVVATGSGEDAHAQHLDGQYAQPGRAGLVPVSVGSGEDSSVIYVPAGAQSLGLLGNGTPRG